MDKDITNVTDDSTADDVGGSPGDASPKKDKDGYVKYDTYSRVLDKVKSFQSKYRDAFSELTEYKEREKALADEKMLEEKKFAELIDQLKEQNLNLQRENETHLKDKIDFHKMSAAMGVLQSKGIQLEQKYFGLLPIEQIEMTDDGAVDPNSVAAVVESFQKEHPRLTLPSAKLFPNESSKAGQMLSVEEWKNLSYADKRQALKEKRVKGMN